MMPRALFAAFLLLPFPALACKCQMSLSACNEVANADVVFIGTVESVSPSFLNHWNAAQRPSLQQLNEADTRFQQDRSSTNLSSLKNTFLRVFPDLPVEYQRRLQTAATHDDLATLFNYVLDHGKRVRFKVKTIFRGQKDDDDARKEAGKKDDDDARETTFDVWTPFGDCGYEFQTGETYLVYADDDEETNIMETGACTRTKRVTDAGPDLGYLYFYHNDADHSGRVEGFVTSNPLYQVEMAPLNSQDKISSPIAGVVLELQTVAGPRFTESEQDGRFIFDGLAAGNYAVTAYEAGYPDQVKLLTGPKQVHVEKQGCATPVLLISKGPQ
jgi:hypothetical protein